MKTIKTLLLATTVLLTAPVSLATASPTANKNENEKIEQAAKQKDVKWISLGQVTGWAIEGRNNYRTGTLYMAIIENAIFYKIVRDHQDYMVQHATKENIYNGYNAFFSLGPQAFYLNVPYWGAPEEDR